MDFQGHLPAPFGDQYSLAFTLWDMLVEHRPLGAFPRLHTLITHGYGVNGRFIPGGQHDRLDIWKCKIPVEAARRVASVKFLAAPSAGTMEKRATLNHKEFNEDLKSIKSGAVSGLDALS